MIPPLGAAASYALAYALGFGGAESVRIGAGFLRKAPQPVGIASQGGGDNLDGYIAPESRVARPVYFAHAARPRDSANS